MSLVTRITQAEPLTRRKLDDLTMLVKALGKVRVYVWNKYGSIEGVGKTPYEIRDEVCPKFKHLNIASHVLQGTVLDAAKNIDANREAAKVEVVKSIFRHTKDENERKRLCIALKVDKSSKKYKSWTEDKYLRRQMRKQCVRGYSKCDNQIMLPCDCYEWVNLNGRGIIDIDGLTISKRKIRHIAIPLRTNVKIEGEIRVILNGSDIEVHYEIEPVDERPCGTQTLGVDKGYTEVLVDSDGESHGDGLGKLLTAESDHLKEKYQVRNRLQAIAEACAKTNPQKAANIEKFNLGRKKLNARRNRHHKIVSALIHEAVHSAVSKAKIIAVEDLTKPFASKDYGADQNRRLSGWVKGKIAHALDSVSSRRRASVRLVNAAYTSQICCACGHFGVRKGDRFYCSVCEDVKRSDHVSARNVLARLSDREIKLYTPYKEVKEILLKRSLPRLRLSNQDSSCDNTSTESELPIFLTMSNCG